MRQRIPATCVLLILFLTVGLAGPAEGPRLHPSLLQFGQTGILHGAGIAGVTVAQPRVVEAIIYTDNPDAITALGIHVNSRLPGFVTALLNPADIALLEVSPAIRYARPAQMLESDNDLSKVETGAAFLHSGFLNNTPYKGKGAIVLVFDSGIDWRHLDFRNPTDTTKSRILFIWDQTLNPQGGESNPSGFNYGVEYTQAQIEAEFSAPAPGFVRERDINGHGTHVAGTAAGNGNVHAKFSGTAPEADIIIVRGGDGGFSDIRMIDGLTYAADKASALGKPMVVNWSIGSMWGPHDASAPLARAADAFSGPGRIHINSAGNSGNSYIHVGGSIAQGSSQTIELTVPAFTPKTGQFNDQAGMILWFQTADAAGFDVSSPSGKHYVLSSGERIFADDADGQVSLGNMISPDNGQRMLYFWVEDKDTSRTPATGTWTLTLSPTTGSVTYDGWMDPVSIGSDGKLLTLTGADRELTMNSFVADQSIIVGSYFSRFSWPSYDPAGGQHGWYTYNYGYGDGIGELSPFSSRGPTRDGRVKPDIVAPGQYILSTMSSFASTANTSMYARGQYRAMQGTSMAAPNVTGCAAVLLAEHPTMTPDELRSLLVSTASTEPMMGSIPNNLYGSGKINILRALATDLNPQLSTKQIILRYDKAGSALDNSYLNNIITLDANSSYAVRFTPPDDGTITGVMISLTWTVFSPGASLVCDVYDNVSGSLAGIPGSRIGGVSVPLDSLDYFTTVYIDLLPLSLGVIAGTDYHVVVSLANAASGDFVKILTDDGTANNGNRSSLLAGGVWTNSEAWSTNPNRNIRIRPVIASTGTALAISEVSGARPARYEVFPNYPNPFNPTTTISFRLTTPSRVQVRIFNLLGQLVRTLLDADQTAGHHTLTWDGKDEVLHPAASGTYIYQVNMGGRIESRRMLLLK